MWSNTPVNWSHDVIISALKAVFSRCGAGRCRRRFSALWRIWPTTKLLKSKEWSPNYSKNNIQWKISTQSSTSKPKATAHDTGWRPVEISERPDLSGWCIVFFRNDLFSRSRPTPDQGTPQYLRESVTIWQVSLHSRLLNMVKIKHRSETSPWSQGVLLGQCPLKIGFTVSQYTGWPWIDLTLTFLSPTFQGYKPSSSKHWFGGRGGGGGLQTIWGGGCRPYAYLINWFSLIKAIDHLIGSVWVRSWCSFTSIIACGLLDHGAMRP